MPGPDLAMPEAAEIAAPQADLERLSPVAQLIRASITLRGVRPSPSEMEAIEADPELLEPFVDLYLDDPRFGAVIRDLHNESLYMTDPLLRFPATGALSGEETNRIVGSIESSALRLVERVVVDDLPYSDIVTADYTIANDVVARAWAGLDGYDFDAPEEWQVVRWSDGRPAAGILSDSAVWTRYRSPNRNFNRGRANFVSRALLCTDYLDSDIAASASDALADPEDTSPLVENGVCAACHSTLDPLASFIPFRENFGSADMVWPMALFTRDGAYWDEMSGQPPGYYGTPGDDLSDLGRAIAEDPRFTACTARRFYSHLAQVPLREVDGAIVDELQEVLVGSGLSAKALTRAVVLHPSLRLGDVKRTRPEQLGSVIEAITGYRWETWNEEECCGSAWAASPLGQTDLLRDDLVGYRTLAGGIDSFAKYDPTHTTNSTSALVLRRLAADAAAWVVEGDLAVPGEARLLTLVGPEDDDEAAIRAQLVALHWQLYGERASEVDADWELWSDTLARTGSVEHAWKTTLTALLQDFGLAFY